MRCAKFWVQGLSPCPPEAFLLGPLSYTGRACHHGGDGLWVGAGLGFSPGQDGRFETREMRKKCQIWNGGVAG